MARLLLALLCGAAALAAAQPRHGRCREPLVVENAVPEDRDDMRLRYACVKDYKRKAGTSSLVVCQENKTAKTFHWISNLSCIRDPSKPEPAYTTEDAGKETETPTPTSQPTAPKTSANPGAFSRGPSRSETTSPPDSSTATTQPRTAKPSPEALTTMQPPQEIVRDVPGTDAKNVTPCKGTMTQDPRPESSKPPFKAPSTEIGGTTAVPSRNAPENATWVSRADIPQGQTGFPLTAVLLPVGLILFLSAISSLWCFCRKHSRFRRPRDVGAVEEIPVVERSGERGRMVSAGRDTEDAGPADEETPMRPSDRATSTG